MTAPELTPHQGKGTTIQHAIYTSLLLDDTTFDSIRLIINAEEEKERDELTKQWMTHKMEELNFIGIVGALLAGCLTSTGDWPQVLGNGQTQPWTVQTCWFGGIVCALFAVLTVAMQSMRLHRLAAHRDGLQRIRDCLAHPKLESDRYFRPRRWRVYTWQVGPVLLAASVLCMVVGMAIMLWVGATVGPLKKDYEAWWDANAKVRFP